MSASIRLLITIAMACGMVAMWIGFNVALDNLREENRALRKELRDLNEETIRKSMTDEIARVMRERMKKRDAEEPKEKKRVQSIVCPCCGSFIGDDWMAKKIDPRSNTKGRSYSTANMNTGGQDIDCYL